MSDTVIGVLGGSGVAAVITLLGSLLFRWLDHRTGRKSTMDKRLGAIEKGFQASMRDRIRCLGRVYVQQQHISLTDREDLIVMHDAYHELGGNGNLDALMDSVMKLQLRED